MSLATILTTRKPYKCVMLLCRPKWRDWGGDGKHEIREKSSLLVFVSAISVMIPSFMNSLECLKFEQSGTGTQKYKTAFNLKTHLQSNWVFSLTNLATKGYLTPTSFPGFSLVLPRGRKRENPGNEADLTPCLMCVFFFFSFSSRLNIRLPGMMYDRANIV